MNFLELYKTYQVLADTASRPHLSAPRFGRLYWVCENDYLSEMARQPSSEVVNRALAPYKKKYVTAGRLVSYANVTPAVLRVRSVRANFEGGRTNMPVTPVDSDSLGEAQLDPFRRGSDDEPLYAEEEDRTMQIYSDTTPLAVQLNYVTFPVLLTDVLNTTYQLPEDDTSIIAVLRRVVAEKDLIDEKYSRYQLLASGKIPLAEKPI